MTDYNTLKVPDLKKLLQDRSLPVSGKKEDLITRLQEDDAKSATASKGAAAAQEDEIDWDDDTAPQTTTAATTEPAAAAVAAGGKGQPANPTAVPNQQQAVDPAKTDDLKPIPPKDTTSADAAAAGTNGAAEEAKPAVDFSIGMAATDVEKELVARKKRAEKFGITESTEDALKALERAKRFGTGTDGERKTIRGLDEALPERKDRKRGREDGDMGGRGGFKRGRGGRGRPFKARRGGGGGGGGGNAREAAPAFSEEDRKKAEARAKRFATG